MGNKSNSTTRRLHVEREVPPAPIFRVHSEISGLHNRLRQHLKPVTHIEKKTSLEFEGTPFLAKWLLSYTVLRGGVSLVQPPLDHSAGRCGGRVSHDQDEEQRLTNVRHRASPACFAFRFVVPNSDGSLAKIAGPGGHHRHRSPTCPEMAERILERREPPRCVFASN